MKLLKLSVIALTSICSTVALGAGPPKLTDLGPQPFQIVLSATWAEDAWYDAESDTFVIDEEKTALLQYVACRSRHTPGTSDNTNFELSIDIIDGSMPSVVVLAGDMHPLEYLGPAPIFFEGSSDQISACLGKNCESMGDGKYVSLTLNADRGRCPDCSEESVDCLVTGFIY